jgi:hypothetical protein
MSIYLANSRVFNTDVTLADSPIKEMSAELANYFLKQFLAVDPHRSEMSYRLLTTGWLLHQSVYCEDERYFPTEYYMFQSSHPVV